MLILSSISSGLEFWSVNNASIYENSESKVFKNITFLGEIYTRCLNFADNNYQKYYNVLILLK